ncbi:NADH-quinone oxidoreductase subunit C [Klebsiella variicola subsp. variicola]|nr:NADH-quinone oxidoreductase subunit C [Klebsiella variicola subsp. variicola]
MACAAADFSVFYHLISYRPQPATSCSRWRCLETISICRLSPDCSPNANWYERETREMFGMTSMATRICAASVVPPTWEGHPLRKDYPARATEFGSV